LSGQDEVSDPKTSMMAADAAAYTRNRFPKEAAASASSAIAQVDHLRGPRVMGRSRHQVQRHATIALSPRHLEGARGRGEPCDDGDVSAGRPGRSDVAARYDLGVDAYVSLWSPIILAPARSVVVALDLRSPSVVLDIGTGSGALVPHLRAAAPRATVVGIDPAREMLRVARDATAVAGIQGDAVSLPVRAGSVDAALLAFVLFHVSDPADAMGEVARVLTAGGVVGTVTWTREDVCPAFEEWDATLTAAGAPPLPAMRIDAGVDTPQDIEMLFTGAGLRTVRIWTEDLRHQWDAATYWQLTIGSGANRMRLQQLDSSVRTQVLHHARRRLDELPLDAFSWTGQVLCAVARQQ
jgi:ubiquinone/menaquinone biosynthesis C-methylase UbiE